MRFVDTFFRLLVHPRLTAALFLVFFLLFCLGLVLPQQNWMSDSAYKAFSQEYPTLSKFSEKTGLQDVYGSAVMKVISVIFAIQLLAFLVHRVPRMLKEIVKPRHRRADSMSISVSLPMEDTSMDRLSALLNSRGYHLQSGEEGLSAIKNRFGRIGTILFHASFLFILAGAWVSTTGGFHGTVDLAEGQPFSGLKQEYRNFTPQNANQDDFPALAFVPKSITPRFSDSGQLMDLCCTIEAGPRGGETANLYINRPYQQGNSVVLLAEFGLAPAFTVRESASGRVVDGVCTNLEVWSNKYPVDDFRLLRPRASVFVRFFPDFIMGKDGPSSASNRMRNPVLEVRIVPDARRDTSVTGYLRLGESLRFGAFELKLEELRKWALFRVSRERGGPWIMIGFLLMVGGAVMRLLFLRRWISAWVMEGEEGSSSLLIGGRAEFFRESMAGELDSIKAFLKGGGKNIPHSKEGA